MNEPGKRSERRMPAFDRISSILRGIAGAKEQAAVLVAVMCVFLVLVCESTIIMLNSLKLGSYAMGQIGREFHVLIILWLFASLLLAGVAVRTSLALSEKTAGPIKRMERLLDKMLQNEDVTVVLRQDDALAGIAERINRLKERRKASS